MNLDDALPGDTVIFTRAGGNHVALLHRRVEGNQVWVIGGNQGNAVSIAPYARSAVRGVRRFKESK